MVVTFVALLCFRMSLLLSLMKILWEKDVGLRNKKSFQKPSSELQSPGARAAKFGLRFTMGMAARGLGSGFSPTTL